MEARSCRNRIIALVMLIAGLQLSCTRKGEDDTSRLNLGLPDARLTKNIQGSLSAQSSTIVLSHVVINVRGPGIAGIISWSWDNPCKESADPNCLNFVVPPTSIEMEVPKGNDRFVQYLGVYQDQQTNEITFYYGDATKTLANLSETVEIMSRPIGGASGLEGQVAGRYLNADGSAPSGKIIGLIEPGDGKAPMKIMSSRVYSGWFSLFVVDGVTFSYVFEDESKLFDHVSLSSSTFTTPAFGQNFLRLTLPSHYRSRSGNSGTQFYEHQSASRKVLGFFGPGASGKRVCYSATSTPQSLNGLYLDAAGVTPLKYVNAASANDVYVEAGGNASADCLTLGGVEWTHFLDLNWNVIGNGDSFAGFRGPFMATEGGSLFEIVNSRIDFELLPGAENTFSGVDVIAMNLTAGMSANYLPIYDENHNIDCNRALAMGFTPIGSKETLSAGLQSVDINSSLMSNYQFAIKVVCPFARDGFSARSYHSGFQIYSGSSGGAYNIANTNLATNISTVSISGTSVFNNTSYALTGAGGTPVYCHNQSAANVFNCTATIGNPWPSSGPIFLYSYDETNSAISGTTLMNWNITVGGAGAPYVLANTNFVTNVNMATVSGTGVAANTYYALAGPGATPVHCFARSNTTGVFSCTPASHPWPSNGLIYLYQSDIGGALVGAPLANWNVTVGGGGPYNLSSTNFSTNIATAVVTGSSVVNNTFYALTGPGGTPIYCHNQAVANVFNCTATVGQPWTNGSIYLYAYNDGGNAITGSSLMNWNVTVGAGGAYTISTQNFTTNVSLATVTGTSIANNTWYALTGAAGSPVYCYNQTASSILNCTPSGNPWPTNGPIYLYVSSSGGGVSGGPLWNWNVTVGGGGGGLTFVTPAASSNVSGGSGLTGACTSGATVYARVVGQGGSFSTGCSGAIWSMTFNAMTGFFGVTDETNFTVEIADNVGFAASTTRIYHKSAGGGTFAITFPAPATAVNSTDVLSGTCSTGFVYVRLQGTNVPVVANCSTGTWNVPFNSIVGFGAIAPNGSFTVEAADVIGFGGASTRSLNRTATVGIGFPNKGAHVSSGTPISGTCTGTGSIYVRVAGAGSPASTTCDGANWTLASINQIGGFAPLADSANFTLEAAYDNAFTTGLSQTDYYKDISQPLMQGLATNFQTNKLAEGAATQLVITMSSYEVVPGDSFKVIFFDGTTTRFVSTTDGTCSIPGVGVQTSVTCNVPATIGWGYATAQNLSLQVFVNQLQVGYDPGPYNITTAP